MATAEKIIEAGPKPAGPVIGMKESPGSIAAIKELAGTDRKLEILTRRIKAKMEPNRLGSLEWKISSINHRLRAGS